MDKIEFNYLGSLGNICCTEANIIMGMGLTNEKQHNTLLSIDIG